MKNKGISLITLIITIIVVVILAGAVILALANNNPVESAEKAAFKNNVAEYNHELQLWISSQYANNAGSFDQSKINKTGTEAKNEKIISSLKAEDESKFSIVQGKLIYSGTNSTESVWAVEVGIISQYDSEAPTIAFETNGVTNTLTASTIVNVEDLNIDANTLQYVWDTQKTVIPTSGWKSFTSGENITQSTTGTWYLWVRANDTKGNINTGKVSNAFVVVEESIVGAVQTVNKTFTGGTSGFAYNNPVIPAGFVAVNTTAANWNNLSTSYDSGLVIQDIAGNQFIWVPIDGTTIKYEKIFSFPSYYGATTSNTIDDTLPSGYVAPTYGFYIARYESSFDYNSGNVRAASKKSTGVLKTDWSTLRDEAHSGYLWNWINCSDAKKYSESMASVTNGYNYDTTKVGTNLITGQQWDAVMKWIQNTGNNVTTDSTSWGNYRNATFTYELPTAGTKAVNSSTLLNTGAAKRNMVKNIYDLAGNSCEWTSEIYAAYPIARGGHYYSTGSEYPAAYRGNYGSTMCDPAFAFRVVLYVK
jgi:Tfp pilus assembly protein PilE